MTTGAGIRKWLTRAVALMLATGLIAGCGSEEQEPAQATAEPTTQETASPEDTTAQDEAAQEARRKRAEARRKRERRERRAEERRARARAVARRAREQERQESAARAEQKQAEPEAAAEPASDCDPNYEGACLDPNSSDYDREGGSGDGPDYTGTVTVVGDDPYDLDRDGDGIACDS